MTFQTVVPSFPDQIPYFSYKEMLLDPVPGDYNVLQVTSVLMEIRNNRLT